MNLWNLPESEEECFIYFQNYNILTKRRYCACSHPMELIFDKDGRVYWKCNVFRCRENTQLCAQSWFERSRISFTTALRFIYCWCEELSSFKFCQKNLKMRDDMIVNFNNYLREICALDMVEIGDEQIGGVDCIVEIDKSIIRKSFDLTRKYDCSLNLFGGICRKTNESFLVFVPDFNTTTLVKEVRKHVKIGSNIFSDCLKKKESGYVTKEVNQFSYSHYIVQSELVYNFIDPETDMQLQNLEIWGSENWRKEIHQGTPQHDFESYLAEFMWKKKQVLNNNDMFDAILKAIAKHSPLETNDIPQTIIR